MPQNSRRDRHPTASHAPDRHGGRRGTTAAGPGVRSVLAVAVVTEALVAGLLAGYGVAVPVGAIAALIISLTARTSLRVGAAAAMGVATADGLYALAAVLGGAALARLIEPIGTPLRWAAAIVLIGLAVRTAVTAFGTTAIRAARGPARDCPRRAGRTWLSWA